MAGGYKPPKTGVDGFKALIADLQRQINEIRGAAGLTSATIGKGGLTIFDPDTGGRMFFGDGNLKVWDDFNTNPDGSGRIYCDPGSGLNIFRIFPPYTDGLPGDNAFTLQGSTPTTPGNAWLYAAGVISLVTRDSNAVRQGEIYMNSAQVVIDTPLLSLFSLPSVGSPDYTLGYDFDGTNWSVCLITSARKYKQDITPAVVDVDAVLEIEPVTFRDRASVERDGDAAKTNFGVIADQLDELGLGELLVTYGQDGEVEAAKYDRIALVLIPAIRKLRDRVDEQDKLRDRVDEQDRTIADLTERLEALERTTS